MNDNVQITAIQKGFRIIEALVELDGATVTELTEFLDLPQSTIHDYLRTLDQLGYTVKDDETHRYRASMRFLNIGEKTRQNIQLYQVAKPHVQKLAEETGERVSLMIEENGLAILLLGARSNPEEKMPHAGTHNRLYAIAPGKAILAEKEREEVEAILDERGLQEYTTSTITDRESLFDALETVRERGHAFDDQERYNGLHGVGVTIGVNENIRGALGLYGPASRLNGDRYRETIPERLKRTANIIEVNMSFP